MTNKEKADKLIKLAKQLQSEVVKDQITKQEFKQSFAKIADLFKRAEARLDTKIDTNLKNLTATQQKDLAVVGNKRLASLKSEFTSLFAKLQKEQSDNLNFIKDKVRGIQDGLDGKDADEELIVEKMLEKIPEKDTAKQIRDGLEELKGKERLDIKAIDDLEERLEKLEKRPLKVGGGTSDMGVQYSLARIVKTETPSGLINATNKVYSTTSNINAVMSFAINGEFIHSSEYTIVNKTITFTTALPADLSGTNFEIIYV